jgi:hypothetical protein
MQLYTTHKIQYNPLYTKKTKGLFTCSCTLKQNHEIGQINLPTSYILMYTNAFYSSTMHFILNPIIEQSIEPWKIIKQSIHIVSERLNPTYNYYIIFSRSQINLITSWYAFVYLCMWAQLITFLNIIRFYQKLSHSLLPTSKRGVSGASISSCMFEQMLSKKTV